MGIPEIIHSLEPIPVIPVLHRILQVTKMHTCWSVAFSLPPILRFQRIHLFFH